MDRERVERGRRHGRDERIVREQARATAEILDAEYGERGITAWALCPGLVLTKLGLSERPTHPERALSTSELANVLRVAAPARKGQARPPGARADKREPLRPARYVTGQPSSQRACG